MAKTKVQRFEVEAQATKSAMVSYMAALASSGAAGCHGGSNAAQKRRRRQEGKAMARRGSED